MDSIDRLLLERLVHSGRLTWAELGSLVGLTGPAIAERVRKLEQSGVIRGYAALVDPDAVGADLTAFVAVTVERPEHCPGFLEAVDQMDQVLECHHIAGEDSYLLKVRTAGTRGLERLLGDGLKRIPGVLKTRSTIVLSTAKESAAPPLFPGERP